MKRNPGLVRKILIYLEEKPNDEMVKSLEFDGFNSHEVMYHFILMDQAGLTRCEHEISSTTPDRAIRAYPFSLTWQEHEFSEASRNETVWNKAKEIVISKSGGLTIGVLKALLVAITKESVRL
ncbi:DUF2513 domain-containing protein [Halioxenophilus aromaticivorans]|uniref:DUF2513 domain-containing protein n=1 Tax=Halioxenophilus aromaticivorans TaxID=1306992 RepID=A0AAV3U3F8_9ALTE